MAYEFTDDQLLAAEKIINERKLAEQKEGNVDLYLKLEREIRGVIINHWGFDAAKIDDDQEFWLSTEALDQVVYQSNKSLTDFRHRYPFSITAFKHLSIIAFWIIKLKPINTLGLKRNGNLVDYPEMNETFALTWLIQSVIDHVENNRVPEFIESTETSKKMVTEMFTCFQNDLIYSNDNEEQNGDMRDFENNKFYETRYYMRYKKMTAINIYESIISMLLPIKFQIEQNGSC